MHLVSDATHGVPLAFTITPANSSETTELPVVLRKTLAAYPWIEPAYLLADRGYDSQANHRFLAEQGIRCLHDAYGILLQSDISWSYYSWEHAKRAHN